LSAKIFSKILCRGGGWAWGVGAKLNVVQKRWNVRWLAPLLILRSVGKFFVFVRPNFYDCTVLLRLPVTVRVLLKAGKFSTKVQSKNECWALHKCPIEAVQPRFWQYLVIKSIKSYVAFCTQIHNYQ